MTNEDRDIPVVCARALSRTFDVAQGKITALDSLDLDIQSGAMTAFVGPDGAGKTTLMRMICGLLSPSSGSLRVLGLDAPRQAQLIQDRISYMPQNFGLYEDLSVSENMHLYADLHGIPEPLRKARFSRLLEMTDLSSFTARPAGKLSGGMKQKLALACSLVRSPDLLLLDEPSVGVDPLSRRDLWTIITRMVEDEHLSVLVSTAYMDEAERCSHVIVLHEGHILAQGPPDELRSLTRGLCHTVDFPHDMQARNVQAWLLDNQDLVLDAVPEGESVRFVLSPEHQKDGLEKLFSAYGGDRYKAYVHDVSPRLEDSFMLLLRQRIQDHGMASAAKAAPSLPARDGMAGSPRETVIEVRELVRRFGDFTAVSSTSFSVCRGEVFGLLGPNGAGKTTTFRMLCGLLPATSGYLRVAGEDLRKAPAQARSRVGYVSQKFSLYGTLSVMENLRFFGGVYGMGPATLRRRIFEVLEQFDLRGHEDTLSGSMPGGFKQRLAMAVGLLHNPEILFLDEPTSGIDPLARRVFWRRITALSKAGTTIVITTHFMEEAEYCDRMLIQDAGKVLALGTPSDVRAQAGSPPTMEEAFIRIVEQSRQKEGRP